MAEPILIWGAGAIGGTIGAYWRRAGLDVLLVDTVAEHVEACRTAGLSIEGPVESFTQVIAGCDAGRDRGRLPARRPRREGAAHRGGARRACAASCRRRLRALGPERAERARDRAPCRARAHHGLLRQFRRRLACAGQDPLRQPRRSRRRRGRRLDPRPHARDARAAQDLRARRGADRRHLGLSLGQARLRRDAVRDRADGRTR